MSVSDIEALGHKLQDSYAAEIRQFVNQIEQLVKNTSSSWSGADGNAFRSWWPTKRAKLSSIADDLHGYGQSALNNAHEQTVASSGGVTAPPAGVAAVVAGGAIAGAAAGGLGGGALPGSDRTWQQVQADYDAKYLKFGLWSDGGPNGENRYQCVSWAWYRMRELGYEGPQAQANGKAVAGALGGTTSTVPQPGAVMSYGADAYGHVVIAEDVFRGADGRLSVRVSEMNSGNDGSSAYAANPQEYQASRVFVQNADGSWATGKGNMAITVANPKYT